MPTIRPADVLAVASIGRGAYVLYDVTTIFLPQATVRSVGLADNDFDAQPSYLTNGTVGVDL